MSPQDIVEVWGRADEYDLTFTHKQGQVWVFNGLPKDMEDGTYAVQIWARQRNGAVGTRTGFLYLSNGVMCIQLDDGPVIEEDPEARVCEDGELDIDEVGCVLCGRVH